MPIDTLGPNRHLRLEYEVPKSRFVRFIVDADEPVKSYVLRPRGYEYYLEGSTSFKYYGGYPEPRRHHDQTVRLPFTGVWYLVIINSSRTSSVEVEYDVYDV